MAIVASTYKKPWYLFTSFLETIYPSKFRKIANQNYQRERLELDDGDFLDLDWKTQPTDEKYNHSNSLPPLLIITHGLEGSSYRPYVCGTVKYYIERGWDVLAWNLRSCSGEMNRLLEYYHYGNYTDLDIVVQYVNKKGYDNIYLIGNSLGGVITTNYLASNFEKTNIIAAAIYSVPFDFVESVSIMEKKSRTFFRNRFLGSLKRKIRLKHQLMPNEISIDGLDKIKSFFEFDTRYTAPINGYKDAFDYYKNGTTINKLDKVNNPLFICNAKNDPFIGEKCYPIKEAEKNHNITMEIPDSGGHLGFYIPKNNLTYIETSSFSFFNSINS